MLRLRPFELARPATLEEALALLHTERRTAILAGGTDLVPKMKRGQVEAELVISLAGLGELRYIRDEPDRLRIGAGTTLRALERSDAAARFPGLHQALGGIATPIIRNVATVGGNLLQDTRCRYYDRSALWREAVGHCLKKDGDVCQVAPSGGRCFATLCSDLAPILIVLDAEVTLAGRGMRSTALDRLYAEDGMAHLRLAGEILTEISVPRLGLRAAYRKLRLRDGFDFPEVGVAVALREDGDVTDLRIAVSGVGPAIFVLRHRGPSAGLEHQAERVYQAVKPMDTLFFPPAYRKKMVRHYILESLGQLRSG